MEILYEPYKSRIAQSYKSYNFINFINLTNPDEESLSRSS